MIIINLLGLGYSYELLGTYLANSFILTVVGAYFGQKIIGFSTAVNFGALLMVIGYSLLLHSSLGFIRYALGFIVVGSAFFKPNMACFVGSLYKIKDNAQYCKAYNIYYASIMVGVIFSTSVSGYILKLYGWDVNFILASICMAFAFIIFIVGNLLYKEQAEQQIVTLSQKSRWFLTVLTCLILWLFMQYALTYKFIAHLEFWSCGFVLLCYLSYELFFLSTSIERRKFFSCIILLIFSAIYWALLFQLFFSFNLMIKLLVNRNFFQWEIPSPIFMGIESIFVIIFSPLLGWFWIQSENNGRKINLFSKYCSAFFACALGLFILAFALFNNPTPSFGWIIFSYAFIGLGEAILAPTALAMIAQLIPANQFALMMAALYVFWGFGTKLADILAQWSIYPATLKDPILIAPHFYNGIVDYLGIALFVSILALFCRKLLP